MTHVFTFNCSLFREVDERPNPINPIGGEGVLRWLARQLADRGFEVGPPRPEDWGWYTRVVSGPRKYLLGASGEWEHANARTDWTVQLELSRSVWQRLLAANRMQPDDALSNAIESVLKDNTEFSNIAVDRGG